MTTLMTLADRLSGLTVRLRSTASGRRRRRRVDHRLQIAAPISLLEERCLLSTLVHVSHAHRAHLNIKVESHGAATPFLDQNPPPFPQMPAGTTMDPTKVMYQGGPDKTVTITNTSGATIFPILQGENSNGAIYDPHDTPPNQEYRVYVGYNVGGTNGVGGTNYFGVPNGQSITVRIPQAIWDSGRLNIVADTPATAAKFEQPGDPFNFDPNATTCVQSIAGTDGMLFLYHSPTPTPHGIADDAPSQLVEWAVRDAKQQPGQITSVDYDLSYLNHMYLPVAVEATPHKGKKFGYIGTGLTQAQLQGVLEKFTSTGPSNGLNGYFDGGQGWPTYYTPDANAPIKIPGGYNVFAQSASNSSYNTPETNIPMLSSSQQTTVTPPNANNYAVQDITNIVFSWANFYEQMWADPAKYDPLKYTKTPQIPATPELAQFMVPASSDPNSIQAQDGVQPFQIQYTNTPGKNDLKHAEEFATLIWKALWTFSADTISVSPAARFLTSTATLEAQTNPQYPSGNTVLTGVNPQVIAQLSASPYALNGTPVVGPPGTLPPRDNIYAIDGNNLVLAQPSSGTVGASETYRFYFNPPNPAVGGPNGQPQIQATSQLVGAILGDNIGDMATIGATSGFALKKPAGGEYPAGSPYSDPKVAQAFTEEVIKPLMYGVTSPDQEKDANIPVPGNPKTDIAAQYNIDPLVWFIHTPSNWPGDRRIFAYAFSVDDTFGNVYIEGPSGMQVQVGGLSALSNQKHWPNVEGLGARGRRTTR